MEQFVDNIAKTLLVQLAGRLIAAHRHRHRPKPKHSMHAVGGHSHSHDHGPWRTVAKAVVIIA